MDYYGTLLESNIMTGRLLGFMLITGSIISGPAFCQSPDNEVTDEEKALGAFMALGKFCDRGIADPIGRAKANSKTGVPQEVLDLLELRQTDLSDEPPDISLLQSFPEVKKRSPEATVDRFCNYGLIELLHVENSKLLDIPLTQRKELMDRLKAISDQAEKTLWAAGFSKGLTENELLIIAGHLRSLSVDLETEIVMSLNAKERVRVGKLISYLLPRAIEEANEKIQKYKFGSPIYDTHGPKN